MLLEISGLCLTTLVAPLVSMTLGFLVLVGVGFNVYLLVRTFETPPQKTIIISLVWVHLLVASLLV